MMHNPIRVGITHGDFNGIGYEVIIKALDEEEITDLFTPVIFGSPELLNQVRKDLGTETFRFTPVRTAADAQDGKINVVDVCPRGLEMTPGHPSKEAGEAAVAALEAACLALEDGEIDFIVTAPINKKTVYSEKFPFPGHTEFLAKRLADEDGKATMILFDDEIRVALVTTHKAIRDVPAAITKDAVVKTIKNMDAALRQDFRMDKPRIAVLSLNPHNGDNGLLGSEEIDEIEPAIAECVSEGILAFGPFAADGFFGTGDYSKYDGIVAMYHDQGLAPFKALAREYGVNYTAGLKYVRTSPDHGTGYNIAGKNEADPTSMRQAIYQGIDLTRNREINREATANPMPRLKQDRKQKNTQEEA
ncbi:MAG: 4-hydroxythreonine-4-phosphate dehydrogenase PdxA [Muribaculaceae bacterium]|nr:4-hydroxythreonine-4-phosphate dehydrogenase PdxA [Muribaculaceae bacterium]